MEVAIADESMCEFNVFVDDLVSAADRETGTMACESNFSDDSRICQIYLRFIDADAAMVHIAMFSDLFIERFLSICDVQGIVVLGYPDEQVCRALKDFNPVVLCQRAGFARFAS